MPLSESEELELLELENEAALSKQGKDPYGRPISRNEQVREEYPSEKFAKYAEPISQFGGAFTKSGPIGAGLAGAATMGTEIVRQGIQAVGGEPGAPKSFSESGGRIAKAFGRGAAGEIIGRGIIGGAGVAANYAAPTARKAAAQGMRVMTGIPEREGMAVLKDPSILSRAKPVEQAGKEYGESTLGLKSGAEGARQAFGKSHLTADAAADKFDEVLPAIKDNTLDLQTAFSLRQSTMDKIADLPYNEKSMKKLLASNIDELDNYIEARLPEWSGARKAFRESKIGEEFSSWLPLNKNLSPNVLRTTAAIASTAKGVMEGNPMLSLALPAVSPKIYGYGIRAGAAVAKPVIGAAKIGARLAGQGIANIDLPSSTEELMQKHYNKQK